MGNNRAGTIVHSYKMKQDKIDGMIDGGSLSDSPGRDEKPLDRALDSMRVKWGESDWEIVCQTCGMHFTFSKGEQDFYKKHNFNSPRRCSECRTKNKAKKLGELLLPCFKE